MSHTKILNPISILLFLLTFSCSQDNEQIEKPVIESVVQPEIKIEPKDFPKFKHSLPESNYSYDIEITSIDFKVHKDAFSSVKEKYDVPEKADGLTLILKFALTNPYNRAMQIPFQSYFEITAEEFKAIGGNHFIYSKSCHCHINNSAEIIDAKGKELYEFTVRNPDKNSVYQQMIDFAPNEKKEFVINFKEPFPNNIKEITFAGFNADNGENHALVIDVISKKIIGRKTMK